MKCYYGCGKEAKFQFKNGKWCCSKNVSSCSFIKNKISNIKIKKCNNKIFKTKMSTITTKRYKDILERKKHSNILKKVYKDKILRKNISLRQIERYKNPLEREKTRESLLNKSHIYKKRTIKYIQKKYPLFSKIEEMRYKPGFEKERVIQVYCKNHLCKNSKEQGGWFTPTNRQIESRIFALESKNGNEGLYFYCCDKCKDECPLFNLHSDPNKIKKELYTFYEYQTFRQQVLKREDYLCEYCGESANTVHHIMPQKLEPIHVLDPDYGLACCSKCHYQYGHKDECSTGIIANKECR